MARKHTDSLSTKTIGVRYIRTSELEPNPHNPRKLFDRAPLEILTNSIRQVGILVPLTVFWSKSKKTFVILDGQRRWMCATKLKHRKVPVNIIAEPSTVQNIVTMFQIHKLREDWELMPTALKLEVLMKKLRARSDRSLAELTGLDQAVVARCKKLLSFPKEYQDMMLHQDPNRRVKADFFIELYPIVTDRSVSSMRWFSRDKFTDRMLEKYEEGKSGLKAVTAFREMKQHITNARRAKKEGAIAKRLREYTLDDTLTLDHLVIQSATVTAAVRRILKIAENLEREIREIDPAEYYGEERLWQTLERLLKLITSKLLAADRRLK